MEVQETLSRPYAIPDEIDETDLEASTSVPPYEILFKLQGHNAEPDAVRMEDEEEGQRISIRRQISSSPSQVGLFINPSHIYFVRHGPPSQVAQAVRTTWYPTAFPACI